MKHKKLSLLKIKRILSQKGYKIQKSSVLLKQGKFKGLYYTSLTSIFLIIFFGIMPTIVNFSSKLLEAPQIIENYSKKNFERVFEGEEIQLKTKENESEDKEVKFTDLYIDILEFDETSELTKSIILKIQENLRSQIQNDIGYYFINSLRENVEIDVNSVAIDNILSRF